MRTLSLLRSCALAGAAALALAACGEKPGAADAEGAAAEAASSGEESAAPDYAALAAAAIANPNRPEEDRADDEMRKPAEALEFFRIAPGMTVFEIEAGDGWFTELMAHVVGSDGVIIMQNPEGFLSFLDDRIKKRLADGRLANVRETYTNFDALDAEDGSVDLATWVQGPHELYFTPKSGPLGDPASAYAEIYRVLKPGGAFVVIDHAAEPGAPETTGDEFHRIDRAIVVDMAEAAGFVIDAESDFLANPDDPLNISVFDPSIRGHTSQFAIRFKKSE